MAKKLNKNVVVGLSMLGFLTIIALSVLMITQLQQNDPKHYVELAQKYKADGDLKRAASLYHRAFDIGNKSGSADSSKAPEYLVSEGEIWFEMGELRRAVACWAKAAQINPQLISAHESQLKLLLDICELRPDVSSWMQVRDAAEALLKVDEGNAFGQNALGQSLAALRTQDPTYLARGVTALTRACELAPDKVDFSIDLANYYSGEALRALGERKGDAAAAEWIVKFDAYIQQLMTRFNQPGPDAPKVRTLYAGWLIDPKYFQFLNKPYDATAAEKMHQEAVTLAGDLPEASADAKIGYSTYLLRLYLQLRKTGGSEEAIRANFDKAVGLLKDCIAAQPDRFDPYLQIAIAYQLDRQYSEAISYCNQRLQRKILRIGLEAEKQRFGAFGLHRIASECALAMTEGEADKAKTEKLLKEAEQYIADALGEVPEHPEGHRQSGKIKWIRGQDREALELFRKADDGFTANGRIDWQTKIILAKVHLRLGESGSARKVLEDVAPQAHLVRADDVEFWTLYARVLNDSGDIERAVAAAQKAVDIAPDNSEAHNLLAASRMRLQGQQPDISKLKERGDDNSKFVAAILEAEEARTAGNVDLVIEKLKEALKIKPDHEQVLRRAIAIMVPRDDAAGARALVEAAIAYNPGDTNLKKLLVATRRDLTLEERQHALLEIIEAETDAFTKNNDLAEYYFSKEEFAKALTAIDEAEKCLTDEARATEASRVAGKAGHRELLARKMLVAARIDNQEALKAAAKSAQLHNVDGANGYTFQGQLHMYREEADQAINAFLEALRFQPTDSRLLTFLGRCYQNKQSTDDARQYFERALESNPNEGLAHKGVAQLAQASGDIASYERHLARCEELLPDDPWVTSERQTRAEEKDPKAAIADRETRLAANPQDSENLRRLAYLCEKSGDFAKAEQYLLQLFELEKKDANLVLVMSTFYHRAGKPEKSLEVLQAHVDSRPTPEEKANSMIWVAAHYMKINDADTMERTLLDAADIAKTFEVCRALGDFYMRVQSPQNALVWLDQAVDRGRLAKSPQLPLAYSARIACLMHPSLGDLTGARQRIEEFRRTYPQDPRGLYWEAEVHARDGDIEKAVASLTAYLDARPNNPSALVQRAHYYMAMGRTAQSISDLETLRNHDPKALDLAPRILLAKLYEATGAKDKAFLELESVVNENPESQQALIALIGLYARTGRYTEAEQRITAAINRAEGGKPSPALYRERAKVSRALGEKDRTITDLKKVVELSEFDAADIVVLLDEYRKTNRAADGLKFCSDNAAKMTDSSSSVAMHATLMKAAGHDDEAIKSFRDAMHLAVAEGGGRSGFVYAMILDSWNPCQAADLFTKNQPAPEMVRANDRILAGVLIRCGGDKVDQVPALLTRLMATAANPMERAELVSQQGQLQQQQGKFEEAAKTYEDALKYNDRDAVALNNLAYLLAEQLKQAATGLRYAQKAATVMPDNANILDTLGWIYLLLGEYDRATAELTRAVQFEDAPAEAWYHLGEAYRQHGKFPDAQNILANEAMPRAKQAGSDDLVKQIDAALKKAGKQDKAP